MLVLVVICMLTAFVFARSSLPVLSCVNPIPAVNNVNKSMKTGSKLLLISYNSAISAR